MNLNSNPSTIAALGTFPLRREGILFFFYKCDIDIIFRRVQADLAASVKDQFTMTMANWQKREPPTPRQSRSPEHG